MKTIPEKKSKVEKLLNQNSILCVTDFSASSLEAIKWSVQLAGISKAHLTVLFCYRLITSSEGLETLPLKRNMEEEASRKFDVIQKDLRMNHEVSCKFVTEIGFIPFRIEMFLQKKSVGLIVMGNSIIENFSDYQQLNFDQFLKSVKIPVVVVPE